jgi:hypothetical protein
MKYTALLSAAIVLTMQAIAQTDIDAFNFSQRSVAGTARFVGMGGAFCATGADLSTMSQNPAGIGLYRRADINLSPSLFNGHTTSDYLGGRTEDGRTGFNLGNAGLVFASDPQQGDPDGWVNWAFGIGYNRLYDFNNVRSFEGFNTTSSLLDYFASSAQGVSYENLDSYSNYLAYYTYLINPDQLYNYTSAAPGGNVLQRRNSETRGGIGETSLVMAGNYMNKLYIGGSVAFSNLRYSEDTYFEEVDSKGLVPGTFKKHTYGQYLETEGSGVNVKFGLIYRAADFIRIGAAVHSPTWYNMSDAYSSDIIATFDGDSTKTKQSPQGAFDYNFTSPFRAVTGMTLLWQDKGLLAIDYEYTDYGQASFSANYYGYSQVNSDVRRNYTSNNTLRAGAEWRFGQVSLRGGYGFSTSPITSDRKVSGYDFSQTRYSAGIGLRDKRFYLDLGYLYSITNSYTQPYYLDNVVVDGSYEKVYGSNFTLTVGTRF